MQINGILFKVKCKVKKEETFGFRIHAMKGWKKEKKKLYQYYIKLFLLAFTNKSYFGI